MSVKPGMEAPSFETLCFVDGEIHNISLNDYRGEWLILFFYPHDFDNLSPADLLSLNEHYNMLSKKNCKILAISTDSCIVKERFSGLCPSEGGVCGLKFPLAEDTDYEISKAYSVLKAESGHALRAYFIIDPEGVIQSRVVSDRSVGIGLKELIRQFVALQKVAKGQASGKEMGQGIKKLANIPNLGKAEASENKTDQKQENKNKLDKVDDNKKETEKGQGNEKRMNKDETHLWYIENCIARNRSGIYESPINIDVIDVRKCLNLDSFLLDYALPNSQSPSSTSSSLVKNTGCSWQVEVPEELNNTLQAGPLGEKIFKLAFYNAHWGRSEHTVNESSYDGELHFVHYNTRYHMTNFSKSSPLLSAWLTCFPLTF